MAVISKKMDKFKNPKPNSPDDIKKIENPNVYPTWTPNWIMPYINQGTSIPQIFLLTPNNSNTLTLIDII